MITRTILKPLKKSLKKGKSILLIGPRQTGKTTLALDVSPDIQFNLSNQGLFLDFVRDPTFLEQRLQSQLGNGGLVFVDEVQRIPSLMNTIQDLIDRKRGFQFFLTGSSARKLRRGRANLLPGRIHAYELGPLTSQEIDFKMDTQKLMRFGSLPEVWVDNSDRDIKKLLRSYAVTYLNEEIKAEALAKNIEGFTRFLFNLAADSAQILDLSKVAKLAQTPRQSVQRYFEVLEDTLLVRRLQAFSKSEKRRLVQHPKFFIFDNGVLNALLGNFEASADRKGQLFENLFVTQLLTTLSNLEIDFRISHYRTAAGAEVDVMLELGSEIWAIEIKSGRFSPGELTGFASVEEYLGKKVRCIVVTLAEAGLVTKNYEVMHWQEFLRSLMKLA